MIKKTLIVMSVLALVVAFGAVTAGSALAQTVTPPAATTPTAPYSYGFGHGFGHGFGFGHGGSVGWSVDDRGQHGVDGDAALVLGGERFGETMHA